MIYYESMGRFELEIPYEAIQDCFHPGRCDDGVNFWLPKIDFTRVTRDAMIDSLSDIGGWSRDDLSVMDDSELQARILWIACGDLKEEQYRNDQD